MINVANYSVKLNKFMFSIKTIHMNFIKQDCDDGSDEVDCEKKTCPSSTFTCKNGKCLPTIWVCDKANDCGDSSDELDCATEKPTPA